MRSVIREFRKLHQLSSKQKNVLSVQLFELKEPTNRKILVIQRFRDKYYQIEDSLDDDILFGLATGIACPPLLLFAVSGFLEHDAYRNARIFCDEELKKYKE